MLLGDPERPDARRDADGHLEGPEEALRRPGPADAVDPPEGPGRLLAEEQVFVHPELGDEVELLVDRADPGVLGLARRPDVYLPALEEDHPPVGPVDPGQDLDQGGLAGPVLSDEHVDLARAQVEVHIPKRHDPREGLRDAPHLQERGRPPSGHRRASVPHRLHPVRSAGGRE